MTDLRLALRLCFRHPLLSLAAIGSLALGIGANTAIFTVLNGSVLQPLPYADPGSLMVVWETRADNPRRAVAPANFLDWRRGAPAFSGSPTDLSAIARSAKAEAETAKAGLAAFDDFAATPIREQLTTVRAIVVMRDGPPSSAGHPGAAAEVPSDLPEYEALLAAAHARWRPGPSSPRPTPPACATRPAPPVTPRASSTRTAALYLHCLAQAMADSLGALRERRHPAHRADVPRQRVVRAVHRDDAGLHPDLRRPQPAAARHLRDHPGREGHVRRAPCPPCGSRSRSWWSRRATTSRPSAASPSAARRRRAACSSTSTRRSAPRWCTPGA